MSVCTMAISAMKKAVMAPMTMTKDSAASDSSNRGDMRETMKMPAVTMVAAWIRAEIGVGPSIESGSQTCSGNCADLPMAPMNRQMQTTLIKHPGQAGDQLDGGAGQLRPATGRTLPCSSSVPQ
jgi:hypothetical protein